jgi:hypothetical protein
MFLEVWLLWLRVKESVSEESLYGNAFLLTYNSLP